MLFSRLIHKSLKLLGPVLIWAVCLSTLAQPSDTELNNLFNLSLKEILKLRASRTISLNQTQRYKLLATTTHINAKTIDHSGARNLDELFEMYVPNLQIIRRMNNGATRAGTRGILSGREDKYLILVNGRELNHKGAFGALTEQDLPMLGDIHHIDVIRGASSVTHGPGAVSHLVSIATHNAQTAPGPKLALNKAGTTALVCLI